MDQLPLSVAVMGATATGKSQLAVAIARQFNGEIISMDSRQVYRDLNIGTGKVTTTERDGIPHHLLDKLNSSQPTDAGSHAAEARALMIDMVSRDRLPLLVGGSGLYFRAMWGELIDVAIPPKELSCIRSAHADIETAVLFKQLQSRDADRAAQLSPTDRVRITRALELIEFTGRPVSSLYREQTSPATNNVLKIVLTMPRDLLRQRIAERTRRMFDDGWVREVAALLDGGVDSSSPGMRGLGYDLIAESIQAGRGGRDVLDSVIQKTQRYAKRQETYFRGVAEACWIDVSEPNHVAKAMELVKRHMSP